MAVGGMGEGVHRGSAVGAACAGVLRSGSSETARLHTMLAATIRLRPQIRWLRRVSDRLVARFIDRIL